MRLTRRGFLGGAVAGGAMFALPRLVRAQGGGSSYSVAVLGDTHFDQALDPDFVASYGDLTQSVSAEDMARYTAQSTYHANWSRTESNAQTHFMEFIRNGDMWRERCPRLVAASAALATSSSTRFILQIGDLVQGDCGKAAVHVQMLNDCIAAIRGGFPSGLPFLTVLGNHDVRGTGARNAYLNFARPFMSAEIANLTDVAPETTAYPVYSFRIDDDLWVFCDFETVDMNPVCDVIDADLSARRVFLVTHGPFTTSAVLDSVSSARWRLAGRSGSEASRPRLYETLSRRHAIVLSGHTHKTDYYWHRNEYGSFAEMTVNSVWMSEDLATAAPIHDKVSDYASPLSSGDYRNEIAYFRPGLKRYFHNDAAGHYRLNVQDDEVTMDFYPGAAMVPARTFTMWKSVAGWVDEDALVTGTTGAWSEAVDYCMGGGRAPIAGERIFTPGEPSGGNVTTLDVTMSFGSIPKEENAPAEGAQGVVWIGTNGNFQVWTKAGGGNTGAGNRWVDVAAAGVTPTVGVDYTFRLKFDYRYGVYSVAVSDGGVMKPLVASSGASFPAGTARFPLAKRKSSVSAVRFAGDGVLTSIFGEYGKKDWFDVIVR